ncbi:butyrophilin-like protein 2 isoform X4 [Lepidochelys kempii]|uniref:butyrophilin-like protein 2 isoform X4 n=1 Tax=Lepidochelys kempii TaxID=8472 RepID=UPI003C6F465E
MRMQVLSFCHSTTARCFLPDLIIFFITCSLHRLESARFKVVGPDQPVIATVGEEIVLPCHLSPKMSAENMEVTWFRSQLSPFVHRYSDGKDQYGQQMSEYQRRTELFKDGLTDGNVALRIFNIRPSDEGQYSCFVQEGMDYEEAQLELKVSASGTAPHISVQDYQDGGIRVVCRLVGWYPQPEVLWRDASGQHLPSLSETNSKEANELFDIENSIVITENSHQNLSCVVKSTHTNRKKESTLFYISAAFFPKANPWMVALSVILMIFACFIGITIYLFKIKDQVPMRMQVLSFCHSTTARCFLPDLIIFFITCSLHRLESARFKVVGPDQPVIATVGEEIVLPCHLSPKMSAENMEVTWFRSQLSPFVHRYSDGKDQYGQQMSEYQRRTELFKDDLTDGNVALRIFNIRPSDEGQYSCFVQEGMDYEEAQLELKVSASGTAPHISVEDYQDGGIRVVCRLVGWYPQPEVLWRDASGQHLPSLSETNSKEANELFDIENSIVITENSHQNLSCVVKSTHTNRKKESTLFYISAAFFPKANPWMVALSVILMIFACFIGITIYLFKIKDQVPMRMQVLSFCHSTTARCFLPDLIIFFITCSLHRLESARFRVVGPDQPVIATVGEEIVLPCHLSPKMSAENMEVTWFRSQLSPFVHRYSDGKDQYGQQMSEYQRRTELFKDGLTDGNVALRIFNIRPSDEGQYSCFVQEGMDYEEAQLELKVSASGTAPHISVEDYQDGGIRVVCRLVGWYPQPEVLWRDASGQHLPSLSETNSKEANELFDIENSIVITENSHQNLSCVVKSTHTNRKKESTLFYISAAFFPKANPWMVALSVILMIFACFIGITIYLFKIKGKLTAELVYHSVPY